MRSVASWSGPTSMVACSEGRCCQVPGTVGWRWICACSSCPTITCCGPFSQMTAPRLTNVASALLWVCRSWTRRSATCPLPTTWCCPPASCTCPWRSTSAGRTMPSTGKCAGRCGGRIAGSPAGRLCESSGKSTQQCRQGTVPRAVQLALWHRTLSFQKLNTLIFTPCVCRYMRSVRSEAPYLPSNVEFIARNNGAPGRRAVCNVPARPSPLLQ